ncbi:MAG: hypothetical protein ABSG16_22835 [Candidatus Acidiferrum sp.]|jgi:hypothetical protein
MLGKRTNHGAAILLAGSTLLLAGGVFPARTLAQDPSQSGSGGSIADAARKSREDKKNAPKNTKVYTDDDVKPATPPATTSPSATPSSDAPPANGQAPAANSAAPGDGSKPPATEAAQANDEKSWRKRFQAQRDQIDRAEKELDVLQREEEKAQVQYYPDPQKALDEGYSRKDINDKDAKIAAKKDEIAKLKQGLSDLDDELRKSGGDPGWSRE